jgi:hypothetical protein
MHLQVYYYMEICQYYKLIFSQEGLSLARNRLWEAAALLEQILVCQVLIT